MTVTQEDFERTVDHVSAQLAERDFGVGEQLAALGLDPAEIVTLVDMAWSEREVSPQSALLMGILIGAQLRAEHLLAQSGADA